MAIFEFTRRMYADEALAAVGSESTLGEVELSACTADMLEASCFSIYLAIQVEVDAAIDRNEFIDAGNNTYVIDIAYRRIEYDLVVVNKVVQPLCAAGKCINDFAFVAVLVARDFTGFIQVYIRIYKHFCMTAQIFNIGLSQFFADS